MNWRIRLLVAICIVAFGCESSVRAEMIVHTEGAEGSRELVIFVHGLTGDRKETWTNAKTGSYWPSILSADAQFEGASVISVEYPSTYLGEGHDINGLAQRFATELLDTDVMADRYDRVAIVAHSLGGIVATLAILDYPKLRSVVRGVFMFGTPWNGSSLADVAYFFSAGNLISDLTNSNGDNKFLRGIRDRWKQEVGTGIELACAYETNVTGLDVLGWFKLGNVIVPKDSVDLLCHRRAVQIAANHINMVKPKDESDNIHRQFRTWYRELMDRERQICLD